MLDPVVEVIGVGGAEAFVVVADDAGGGAEIVIELVELFKVRGGGGDFVAALGDEPLLITHVGEHADLIAQDRAAVFVAGFAVDVFDQGGVGTAQGDGFTGGGGLDGEARFLDQGEVIVKRK